MASRRTPLAHVPNAANSPFRNAAAVSAKRTRVAAGDAAYGQPPTKKQVIEIPEEDEENIDPRRRSGVAATAGHEKLDEPGLRRSNTKPTSLDRKLAAAREKKLVVQQQPRESRERAHRANADNLESIRQWQRHYRKQFPTFVIYFDCVADDVRAKIGRQLQSLGTREEIFFSKAVTHVVTTRDIPPEPTSTSAGEDSRRETGPPKPIQPAALSHGQGKTASILDAHLQRRTQVHGAADPFDVDPRRPRTQGPLILGRARQLGIKIWALEKLQRMLSTILDTDTGGQATPYDTRGHVTGNRATSKSIEGGNLEQLLRNEKINGPADRDMTVAAQDMTTFRGCYIYIHDMDEKTKPTMIRDYTKPAVKEQGKWPQFWLTPVGHCPFVEDTAHTKKLQRQEAATKAQEEIAAASHKTRSASAQESAGIAAPSRVLPEHHANLRRSPRKLDTVAKPLDPPKVLPTKGQSSAEGMPPLFGSTQLNLRGLPRTVGGEPIASGVRPSNITSAIRSQYVSSTAISSTAPGANHRVGDTKEVMMLKRKVLERGASVTSNHSMPSSYMNDMRAAINNDQEPPPRAAKRKAQETLGVVHEDDEHVQNGPRTKQRKTMSTRRRKPVEKDPKPGYCENCRDKFDDFDEHIQSRKHRKFAVTQDNWKELDSLLCKLRRPHKEA